MADKKAPGKRLPRAFDDEMIQRWNKKTRRYYSHGTKNDDEMIHLRTLCSSRHLFGESLCHFQGFVVEHMLSTDRELKLQAANCPWPKSLWRPRRSHAIFRLVGKDKLHYSKSKRPLPPPLQAAVAHPPPLPHANIANSSCGKRILSMLRLKQIKESKLFIPSVCLLCAFNILPSSPKKSSKISHRRIHNFIKFCTSGSISTGSTGSTSSASASCVLRTTGSQGRKQWQHVGTFNALLFRLHLFCDLIHFYCFLQHHMDTCNFVRSILLNSRMCVQQFYIPQSDTYIYIYIHFHNAETNVFTHCIAWPIFCCKCRPNRHAQNLGLDISCPWACQQSDVLHGPPVHGRMWMLCCCTAVVPLIVL